jgi:hypothetical protein
MDNATLRILVRQKRSDGRLPQDSIPRILGRTRALEDSRYAAEPKLDGQRFSEVATSYRSASPDRGGGFLRGLEPRGRLRGLAD